MDVRAMLLPVVFFVVFSVKINRCDGLSHDRGVHDRGAPLLIVNDRCAGTGSPFARAPERKGAITTVVKVVTEEDNEDEDRAEHCQMQKHARAIERCLNR